MFKTFTERFFGRGVANRKKYKVFILCFTFVIYSSFHLSRKSLSVVKGVLHGNCTHRLFRHIENSTCGFSPFDGKDYGSLFGELDFAYLIVYAIFMFFGGMLAERIHIRIFLSIGMLLCGITTSLFGLGYYLEIHNFSYYVFAQILAGIFQVCGWPSVVTCVGNWFGKSRRGLLMGIWNSHTSCGNILGSLIAGAFVNWQWGLSFIVPGAVIATIGLLTFLLLVPYPSEVDCDVLPKKLNGDLEPFLKTFSEEDVESDRSKRSSASDEDWNVATSSNSVRQPPTEISFYRALRIPGVVEYSFCLCFAKMVSYVFLYWLPVFIKVHGAPDASISADMSTLFDVGGILGGISAGYVSDHIGARGVACSVMLVIAIPVTMIYYFFNAINVYTSVGLLTLLGFFVNGPYALISTAVSADLGTHSTLKNDYSALATVSAIIDGTGSIGAAIGPFLCGWISQFGWFYVFVMLDVGLLLALLFLCRILKNEICDLVECWNLRGNFRLPQSGLSCHTASEVRNERLGNHLE